MTPITLLPLLTEAEEQQQLSIWNSSEVEFPAAETIPVLFERQVARTPDAVALVFEGKEVSYSQLNAQANQVAHHLRSLGVGPEVLVGICVERSIQMMVGILGVLKAGGAYVPIDTTYPPERRAFMLEDAAAPVLLTQASVAGSVYAPQAVTICFDTSDWDKVSVHPLTNPEPLALPDNAAYVIYTSGSTGKPKGVVVTHSNVERLFGATEHWFSFDHSDTWTMFHSFAFDFSVWEIWGALLYGGRLVIVPLRIAQRPDEFHKLLIENRVTILNQTPSAFGQLMRADEKSALSGELCLRAIVFGGEALEFKALQPWIRRHGDKPALINMYGITETTVHVTFHKIDPVICDEAPSLMGVPIPDLQVYILDRHLKLVPIGVAGELFVVGAGLARGYLNRPELTSERFISNPFSKQAGARLYKTGDLARFRADGQMQYLGRADQQVKIRGFRIELGEIEAVLISHPAVHTASVIPFEKGLGDKQLVAYYMPVPGRNASSQELRALLRGLLPEYMVPAKFIALDAVPLTANGKLDRKALPEPDWTRADDRKTFTAPVTAEEKRLAAIWADLFALSRIDVKDSFFDLGGHSLLAAKMIGRIEAEFHVSLPLIAIQKAPNIQEMALLLVSDQSQPFSSERLVLLRAGTLPALFCIPGSGSDVLTLRESATHMGGEHAIYATQPLGLQGDEKPLDTVEEIAADALSLIQAVQPEGEYHLAGYSAGALVAFEMARILRAQGNRTGSLILLDPSTPARRSGLAGFPDFVEHMIRRTAYHLGKLRHVDPEAWLGYVGGKKRVAAERRSVAMGVLRGRIAVYDATNRAVLKYMPEACELSGLLIAAEVRPECFETDYRSMWAKMLWGGVKVFNISGDHFSILKQPHVQKVSEEVTRYLSGRMVKAESSLEASASVSSEITAAFHD